MTSPTLHAAETTIAMTTSRAWVFSGSQQPLELQDLPVESLRTGEVRVAIDCCTLCGSDLHTIEGRRSTPLPTVLGHEMLGRVIELPRGETILALDGRPLEIGARVTWGVAASCKTCFYCTHDLPQKCQSLFKYGHESLARTPQLSGGLAETCHLAAGTAIAVVPEQLSFQEATPASCATATVAAAIRASELQAGEHVVVQGCGMLGLTAIAWSSIAGSASITGIDIDAGRLQQARTFGATHTILSPENAQQLTDEVLSITEGRGCDVVLEMSGSTAAVERSVSLLRPGGRLILVGSVFPQPAASWSAEQLVRKCLTIRGMHNYTPADLQKAVEFLVAAHDKFPFASLVPLEFALDDLPAAIAAAHAKRPPRVAILNQK